MGVKKPLPSGLKAARTHAHTLTLSPPGEQNYSQGLTSPAWNPQTGREAKAETLPGSKAS